MKIHNNSKRSTNTNVRTSGRYNFKYLFPVWFILFSSCIGTKYSTHLLDQRGKDNVLFKKDSTIIYTIGNMKEWNKLWGIIKLNPELDTTDYMNLSFVVKSQRNLRIKKAAIDIESVKTGNAIQIKDAVIRYDTTHFNGIFRCEKNIADSIEDLYFKAEKHDSGFSYLYSIRSNDSNLFDCDTFCVKSKLLIDVEGNIYDIYKTDTLYRKVKKDFRFMMH